MKPSKMALVNTLAQLYKKFDYSICKGNLGPIERFWQSYLDMDKSFLTL